MVVAFAFDFVDIVSFGCQFYLSCLVNFAYSMFNAIKVFQGGVHLVDNLYFESCAMIIFFVKLGRYIDSISKDKTKAE